MSKFVELVKSELSNQNKKRSAEEIANRMKTAAEVMLSTIPDEKRAKVIDLMADFYCELAGDNSHSDGGDSEQQWELTDEDNITLIQSLEDAPLIVVNGKIYTPDEALELSAKLIKIHNLAMAQDEAPPIVDDIPESITIPANWPHHEVADNSAPDDATDDLDERPDGIIGWVNRHANGHYGGVYKSVKAARSTAPENCQDIALPICIYNKDTITGGTRGVVERIFDLARPRIVGYPLVELRKICNEIFEMPKADLTPQGWGTKLGLMPTGEIYIKLPNPVVLDKEQALSLAATLVYQATRK